LKTYSDQDNSRCQFARKIDLKVEDDAIWTEERTTCLQRQIDLHHNQASDCQATVKEDPKRKYLSMFQDFST